MIRQQSTVPDINYVIPTTIISDLSIVRWHAAARLVPERQQQGPLNFTGGNTWNLCPGIYYLDGEASAGLVLGRGGRNRPAGNGMVQVLASQSSLPAARRQLRRRIHYSLRSDRKLSAPTSSSPSGCDGHAILVRAFRPACSSTKIQHTPILVIAALPI